MQDFKSKQALESSLGHKNFSIFNILHDFFLCSTNSRGSLLFVQLPQSCDSRTNMHVHIYEAKST